MAQELYPLSTRNDRIALVTAGSPTHPLILVGDLTNVSAVVTNVTDTTDVLDGASIVGDGVPAGTTVVSHTSTTITLSAAATHTQAAQYLFQPTVPFAGKPALNGSSMRLYQSSYSPNITTVYADLAGAEPTFAGYAPITGVFAVGFIPPTNIPQSISQLLAWSPSDALAPQTIGGVWATDGTNVIGVWPLDQAVALNSPANELAVVCADAFPAPGFLTQVRP